MKAHSNSILLRDFHVHLQATSVVGYTTKRSQGHLSLKHGTFDLSVTQVTWHYLPPCPALLQAPRSEYPDMTALLQSWLGTFIYHLQSKADHRLILLLSDLYCLLIQSQASFPEGPMISTLSLG